jgi:hypothetical protein
MSIVARDLLHGGAQTFGRSLSYPAALRIARFGTPNEIGNRASLFHMLQRGASRAEAHRL